MTKHEGFLHSLTLSLNDGPILQVEVDDYHHKLSRELRYWGWSSWSCGDDVPPSTRPSSLLALGHLGMVVKRVRA